MHQARILAKSGHKQKEITDLLGVCDRTVRKYLRSDYRPRSRPKRSGLLDPFKPEIDIVLQDKPFFNLAVFEGGNNFILFFIPTKRHNLN